ncbi:MAG: LmeA family phospholipid-binding protein, partial [Dietzia sp.]
MRARRSVAVATAALAVVVVGAVTVDSVNASRVEADVSTRIRAATPGVAAPSVMIGGGPTSRWSGPETLASASIRAEGVSRPGLGPVAVEAVATGLHVPGDRSADMTAESVTVAVHISGDALGPALGMRDVLVGASDDPSLAGGVEHRARVTGTLAESGSRVSAIVDLVVDDRGAHLVPVAGAPRPPPRPGQCPDHLVLAAAEIGVEPHRGGL